MPGIHCKQAKNPVIMCIMKQDFLFLREISPKQIKEKTCLLRIDLDIDNREEKNNVRIKAAVKTINYLRANKVKIIIISHRGRPTVKNDPHHSLKKLIPYLEKEIRHKIIFVPALDPEKIKDALNLSKEGIILLENLRFNKGEEKNSKKFAKILATCADIYVNDAFAVTHRTHASVYAITKLLPSYGGLHLEDEINHLNNVLRNPKKPFTLIIGGAKIKDKLGVIQNLEKNTNKILIGGAVGNTLLYARGNSIQKSLYNKEELPLAKKLLKNKKIQLPVDLAWQNKKIIDIGERTIAEFKKVVYGSKTIVWNGPLGEIEKKEGRRGTVAIIKAITDSPAFSLIGGGETVRVLCELRKVKDINWVSVGGGAMLQFLSGKKLPGLEALRKK